MKSTNKTQTSLFFILLVSFSTHVYSASYPEGCGKTETEARKALGHHISTTIESQFSSEVSEKKNPFFDFFTRNTTSMLKQKSEVALCGTQSRNVSGEICIRLTDETISCAKNRLETQMSYLVDNLPTDDVSKLNQAGEWLADINTYRPLYNMFRTDGLDLNKLNKLQKIENDLLTVFNQQFVRFNIKGDQIKIKIDGQLNVKPNKNLTLKNGNHSFVITSPGMCKIIGDFNLDNKKMKIIRYNLANFTYPVLTFHSKNASHVNVDGKRLAIGKTLTINRCEGEVPYTFSYNGKVKAGTIKLRPGIVKTITKHFASKAMFDTAKAYKTGDFWQAQYNFVNPSAKNQGVSVLSGIKLGRITHNNYYRYGYQVAISGGEKNSYAIETTYSIKYQVVDYSNSTDVFFIGPFLLIPHIGLDAGLSYQRLDGEYTYENSGDNTWETFYKSYLVFRPIIGLDVTLNSDISLNLSYGREFLMSQSNTFTSGVMFRW